MIDGLIDGDWWWFIVVNSWLMVNDCDDCWLLVINWLMVIDDYTHMESSLGVIKHG